MQPLYDSRYVSPPKSPAENMRRRINQIVNDDFSVLIDPGHDE